MATTRRGFLGWLGVVLAAGAVAAWWRPEPLRRWLLSAGFAPAPVEPLRDSTAAVLHATVIALLDQRVESAPYVELFRWRAMHVPGAGALYRRFELAVDRAAQDRGGPGFRGASREVQRRVLAGLLPARGLARVRRLLVDRDEARFARHVVREIFRRFARTDAWILSGYAAWPGMPRAIARMDGGGPRA
jgi:hypothetical protein